MGPERFRDCRFPARLCVASPESGPIHRVLTPRLASTRNLFGKGGKRDHGKFVHLLRELNGVSEWRKLVGKRSKRLKDMELILRFLAFLFQGNKYKSPMKLFLNSYMAGNRLLAKQSEKDIREIFLSTTKAILAGIGTMAFRPRRGVIAAAVDSIMTGVAKRIQNRGTIAKPQRMKAAFDKLMKDTEYREAIETGTSQEANVETRISRATSAFASVP